MGDFTRQVKNRKIHGPHERKFKRADWEVVARRDDTDLDDKRLAWSGIFFDDLLTFLRSERTLFNSLLKPGAIARIVVGLATRNYCRIAEKGKIPEPKPVEHSSCQAH